MADETLELSIMEGSFLHSENGMESMNPMMSSTPYRRRGVGRRARPNIRKCTWCTFTTSNSIYVSPFSLLDPYKPPPPATENSITLKEAMDLKFVLLITPPPPPLKYIRLGQISEKSSFKVMQGIFE